MSDIQPEGYLALPKSGTGAGVVVLHAWWGLNPFFKNVCQRLARAGFVAFAPDLYHGHHATVISEAERLSNHLQREEAEADIGNAISYLRGGEAVTSATVGVIGFSLGAFFALSVSCQRPQDVGAVVTFYGTRDGDYTLARAAYLSHFAESDEWEPASNVQQFEQRLRAANRPARFYTYPGTGHWFFEKDRPDAYHAKAARLAWQRTVKFLRTQLAPSAEPQLAEPAGG